MTDTDPRQPGGGPATAELLEDWITIWQSELAALVLDRETQDTALRLVEAWATQSRAAIALLTPMQPRAAPDANHDPRGPARSDDARGPAGSDDPRGPAGSDAAPGPAPAHVAPDGRDALVEHLLARVAELERRLAGLDTAVPREPG